MSKQASIAAQLNDSAITVHTKSSQAVLSQNTLWWMICAEALLFVFHPLTKATWLYLLAGACILWRIAHLKKWVSLPSPLLRKIFVLLSCAGVAISYDFVFQMNSGVALFFAAFALKLLEVERVRDCYFWCYLAFFLTASMFLFNTSIFIALLGCCVLLITVTVLYSLNLSVQHWSWKQMLTPAKLMLFSIPFMLVLFILFPRITPLWRLAQQNHAISGISDSMAPGEIAKVANSSEIAFRAAFTDDVDHIEIAADKLYWRSVVLTFFDGHRWSTVYQSDRSLLPDGTQHEVSKETEILNYDIMAEPNYKKLLYLLDYPVASPDTDFTIESLARAKEPLISRMRYKAQSVAIESWPQKLAELERQRYLQLPQYLNPQARQLATDMFSNSQEQVGTFVSDILRYIQEEPFYYTLEPSSLLGRHSIDEFLFKTQRGFCAHYAGAMTFMLRSIGIPARVVLGYQGGEYNAVGRYYTIRQLDAHAWVEYWVAEKGWIRVDPTTAVAPYRVQNGMQSLLDAGELSITSQHGRFYSAEWLDNAFFDSVGLQFDHINYLWNQWVLEYNQESQNLFLEQLLGNNISIKLSLLLGFVIITFTLVLLVVFSYSGRLPRNSLIHAYIRYCKKLSHYGLPARLDHEGAVSYLNRTSQQIPGVAQDHHRQATQIFINTLYNKEFCETKNVYAESMMVGKLGVFEQLCNGDFFRKLFTKDNEREILTVFNYHSHQVISSLKKQDKKSGNK